MKWPQWLPDTGRLSRKIKKLIVKDAMVNIGVDFGERGAARARFPNNWETPMYLSAIATFCPHILVSPNIFDKSTPVMVKGWKLCDSEMVLFEQAYITHGRP